MGGTFYGCSSLVDAPIIPNSVTYMSYTFANCTNLAGTVRVESCDTYIDSSVFEGTINNITFEVPAHSMTANNVGNLSSYQNVSISEYQNNMCFIQ